MNSKLNYIIFNILTVLAYFYGVVLLASIIFIPISVYSIIAAHRFSAYADMNSYELACNKQRVRGWIIFGCVLYFPFGLLGLLCLPSLSNKVKVTDTTESAFEAQTSSETNAETEPKEPDIVTEVEVNQALTPAERAEKIEKLTRFKDNGLITEDEYKQAISQLDEDK